MGWFSSAKPEHAGLKTSEPRVIPLKVLSAFMSTQVITQVIALAVGLIIVRLLPIEQYAVYALFGALVGAGAVVSDLGSSGSYLTLVSRSSNQEEQLKLAAETAQMRSGFTLISVSIFAGLFLWLTPQIWWKSIVTVSFLAAVVFLQANAVLNRARLAADDKLTIINRADPFAALVRLLLLGGALTIVGYSSVLFPIAVWAFSAAFLAAWLQRNVAPVQSWPPAFPNGEMRKVMLPLLPGHLYYIIAGLLPVLSLSKLGATLDIAEFWALGRLAAVFAVIIPMLNLIAHPYVSRGHDEQFAQRSLTVVASAVVLVALIVILGWLFPELWLLVLGGTYVHLNAYVWMALLVPGIGLLSAVIYTMAVSSGETSLQYLVVPIAVSAQILVLWLSPITDIESAFRFALLTAGVQLFVQFLLYLRILRIFKARLHVVSF